MTCVTVLCWAQYRPNPTAESKTWQ